MAHALRLNIAATDIWFPDSGLTVLVCLPVFAVIHIHAGEPTTSLGCRGNRTSAPGPDTRDFCTAPIRKRCHVGDMGFPLAVGCICLSACVYVCVSEWGFLSPPPEPLYAGVLMCALRS